MPLNTHFRQLITPGIFCLALFLFMSTGFASAASKVDAWLDINRVNPGESVELTIKAPGGIRKEPDISPIKKDFEILATSSSTNVSIVNGSMSTTTLWHYTLLPKKEGRLRIPPIKVGNQLTPELVLMVAASGIQQGHASGDIFLETSCEPPDPFIQQEVICTIRLFYANEITEGSLSEPSSPDAIIKRLGKDEHLSRSRDSRRYSVLVRRYAIFPQKSGELALPAPVFDGEVTVPRKGKLIPPGSNIFPRDPFFSQLLPGIGGTTRHVRKAGEAVTLHVKPIPSNWNGKFWLPAKSLEISQQWEPENEKCMVGDPVTRTITITARGLRAEQLPDLDPASTHELGIYTDRPSLDNQESRQGIIGKKIIKIVYIPQKSGKVTIPAIRFTWFNTVTQKVETASLPSRTIDVAGHGTTKKDAGLNAGKSKQGIEPTQPVFSPKKQGIKSDQATASRIPKHEDNPTILPETWKWLALSMSAMWLITLGLLIRERRLRKTAENDGTQDKKDKDFQKKRRIRELKKEFHRACGQNNARAARNALLKWAQAKWHNSPPAGLSDIAHRIPDPAVSKEIMELNRALYSETQGAWQRGRELSALLKELPEVENTNNKNGNSLLPPLYPR